MNTKQSYVNRGTTPSTSSPVVDAQPMIHSTDPEQLADYQRTVNRIQGNLLDLLDEYCGYSAESNPVKAINDLLYYWLSTPAVDLASQADQNRLRIGLELVNFLTALNVHLRDLSFFNDQIETLSQQAGKEVSHD